jgi:anti-sigma factor RsiW
MNRDQQLKIQALVDHELSPGESSTVSQWLAQDAEAEALARELRLTRAHLVDFRDSLRVTESREFYWSVVARRIESADRQPSEAARPSLLKGWLRWFIPVAATGVLAMLIAFPLLHRPPALPGEASASQRLENFTETPEEDMFSVTFRSEREGVTVVWVQAQLQ